MSTVKTQEELQALRAANKGKPAITFPSRAHPDSICWTLAQFKRATGPLVYIWWGKDGDGFRRAIYVGQSANGLNRPLDPKHHRKDARNYLTDLEFICCATVKDALNLEAKLIRSLDPIDNRVRPGATSRNVRPYKPRMYRQHS